MRKGMCAFVVLLASFQCHAQWVRLDKETIRLQGAIDDDAFASYLKAAEGGYSVVELRSEGGFPMPALLTAQHIQKHKPKIIVDGYCISACANYLMVAAPAPHVRCGSVVAWHGTPSITWEESARAMKVAEKDPSLIARYRAWGERFSMIERSFYADIGIDWKLLPDSLEVVQREGVVAAKSFTFNDLTGSYTENVTAGLWVPLTAALRGYGIDTRNFCETYDMDIPAAMASVRTDAFYTTAGAD